MVEHVGQRETVKRNAISMIFTFREKFIESLKKGKMKSWFSYCKEREIGYYFISKSWSKTQKLFFHRR